ncbi:MAG: hypothetical protein ACRC20_01380 [Segniliparus sp.]|uniref:hypothetical protein n=1 Tax=Segniliparus sp. TaxID=2804064 RepID=UPI003F30C400
MVFPARWRQSSRWWSYGFPVVGMLAWGCGTLLAHVGWSFLRDAGASSSWRHFPEALLAVSVMSAFLGCFFALAASAGAGLAAEFAKNATSGRKAALAALCALALLAPWELAVRFFGLPMGDGPVNNFGLGFNFRLPWASPYAHAVLVGVGARFAIHARERSEA